MKRVVLYIRKTNIIGGIETFMYNFCVNMHKDYDITIVVNEMHPDLVNRLSEYAKVIVNSKEPIECDTLLMLRIGDPIPEFIKHKKVIRRIHCMKAYGLTDIPHDADTTVCISHAVKEDFGLGDDALVINNLANKCAKPTLLLVSATRIPAPDKGDNEVRMRMLANMLNKADIPFLWLNFSDGQLADPPRGFYNVGLRHDIQNFIQKADYLVQLSSLEAFGNSVLEALTNNTAVICTPIPAFINDLGVTDGTNGYIVPFDMNFDVSKLLNIPKFMYYYNNDERIKQWKEIL